MEATDFSAMEISHQLGDAINKANQLVSLLREAKELADSLEGLVVVNNNLNTNQ